MVRGRKWKQFFVQMSGLDKNSIKAMFSFFCVVFKYMYILCFPESVIWENTSQFVGNRHFLLSIFFAKSNQ